MLSLVMPSRAFPLRRGALERELDCTQALRHPERSGKLPLSCYYPGLSAIEGFRQRCRFLQGAGAPVGMTNLRRSGFRWLVYHDLMRLSAAVAEALDLFNHIDAE